MSVRRVTDPQFVQAIWETIKLIINQKTLPSSDRVLRHLARALGVSDLVAQNEIKKALKDGLIESKKALMRSSNLEQESYRLPSEVPQNDGHDWYCYKCHLAGEVDSCHSCHRVYHGTCYEPKDSSKKICGFCELIANDVYNDRKDLNYILKFMCGHLKAKLPPVICERSIILRSKLPSVNKHNFIGKTWLGEGEDKWRPDYLIYHHMDLTMMELKVEFDMYKNLSEFKADAHNILHNIFVYHGSESYIARMATSMYDDCCYDVKEIRRCPDCYKMSNAKPEKLWYCIPCDPPHELVFAKQKGYCYWPAKVMEIKNDTYDVRFFGSNHTRAHIDKANIRPITSDIDGLQIKRNSTWNKAYAELQQHQQMLQNLPKREHKIPSIPEQIKSKKLIRDLRVTVERMNSEQSNGVPSKESLIIDEEMKLMEENSALPPEKDDKIENVPLNSLGDNQLDVNNDVNMDTSLGVQNRSPEDNMVSSSCTESGAVSVSVQTDPAMATPSQKQLKKERLQAERNHAIENLINELETKRLTDMENLKKEHAKEILKLKEELSLKHEKTISEVKKRQWCYNCESEAIYHCCWNTAYCSTDCQQVHWQTEHKRVCRRTKNK